jgi:dTDP-4-amino-4,6-dideoxygalactose transaminase
MTEFQAALLLAQLSRLEGQVQRREQNAARLDQALADLPGIQRLAPTPEMTRRSYHMYIFRVNPAELGCTRQRMLEALNAEGLPASEGWYRPLYRNRLFQSAHIGPPHGILAPLAARGADYRNVSCPVCEQVCQDAVWIPHSVLLAESEPFDSAIRAIQKVARNAHLLGPSSAHA